MEKIPVKNGTVSSCHCLWFESVGRYPISDRLPCYHWGVTTWKFFKFYTYCGGFNLRAGAAGFRTNNEKEITHKYKKKMGPLTFYLTGRTISYIDMKVLFSCETSAL